MDDWIIGSKDITRYFDKPDWPTCRDWMIRNGIKILRLPSGAPMISRSMVHNFFLRYNANIGVLKNDELLQEVKRPFRQNTKAPK